MEVLSFAELQIKFLTTLSDIEKKMSSNLQPKATTVKTYSEAVLASEGTRSKPSKLIKATSKKTKKQYTSPEVVPSEWDQDLDFSSESEKRKSKATVVRKPAKPASKPKNSTSKDTITIPETTAD
ncbi:hypothetical protein PGT21_019047 [Puccinia graminis f. sp. tritici]|uniref:Uncharacterized protein n=2 Tax=Puccinia graminis f. sp. tritici TaxID=56615 RepID=A0A5B0PFE5_PUCGR|nr:hypothetical protein PGTUg99_029492 [Puccinia graminis f. sp. tritici]KAA1099736.1 hypothetical protein PGT21_019047 [Puccinia graminis f. sp. tritici]KAA1103743.1 hypothetical protein PGTUg99_007236 [Puccinia graminis f. sp. tritici]